MPVGNSGVLQQHRPQCTVGYTSVLLLQLKKMRLSTEQESWIASMLAATMVLGILLTAPTMRRGRKVALQVVSLLHITSWIVISFAPNYEVLLVGRGIQGAALGLFMSISGIIIGEYTSPKHRGSFLATLSFGQAVGISSVHICGSFVTWQHTALLFSFLPLISFIITIFLPESPSWLALEERYEDCKNTFRRLRGCDEEEELKKMIEARQLDTRTNGSAMKTLRSLRKREVYISLILGALMYNIAIVSGATTLASFLNETIPVIISDNCYMPAWMVFCDGVRLISNGIGLFVVGRMRRRVMLFSSGALCVIAYLAQAGYIYAKAAKIIQEVLWLPIVLLTLHISTIGLGVMLIPMMIIGEIYPLEHRSLCSAVTNCYLVVCMFAILKTFAGMKVSIGLEGAYLVYAVIVALALVVSWFILPETKGRTLQEIEEYFRRKPTAEPEDINELKPLKSPEQKEVAL
ncbi:facilitated trehalose transporter Tret1-like [Choristoneura fumiferana]|uniref:facilitated trehalose transporter Tret1-like n=1 Tax=Choristoneura fumiferana TaxID=7141 RepID=UPI003D15B98C